MDGLASWTEIGRTGGRDPLAMLSAVEYAYQTQLPGISTITERLRYYAFHCWWISHYADTSPTKSAADYGDCARRFEFLYALASLCVPDDPQATSDELGILGANCAARVLQEGQNQIDFRYVTARETPAERRYIKPAMGDFANSYASQMREIGLLRQPKSHGLNVPTERGLDLAARFEESLGEASTSFRETAKSGIVDRNTLARLAQCRPGAISPESDEAEMLRDLLMARLEPDPEAVPERRREATTAARDAAIARRDTLLWILDTAKDNPDAPVSQDMLRWHWVETPVASNHPRAHTHARWQHYQCGDTARVACEALLAHAVREISRSPRDIETLLAGLTEPLDGACNLGAWLADVENRQAADTLQTIQSRALDGSDDLYALMGPLARLHREWGSREPQLAEAYPEDRPGRQTVRTLLRWIERQKDRPARNTMADFFRDFIIMRHLAVAAGKFRANSAYTYLFELHDRELHWKQSPSPSPSGPRLKIALRFLEDLDLLKDGHITKRGEALLHSETA